jgi:tetratricopeptide (TPR) repeat protein
MNNFKNDQVLKQLLLQYEEQYEIGATSYFSIPAFQQLLDYFLKEYEYSKALEVCEQAIEQHAFSSTFYLKKAQILVHRKKYASALDTLEIGQLYSPMEGEILLLKAEAFIGLDKHQEARDILDHLKPIADHELLSRIFLIEAQMYMLNEEYERTFYILKAAVQANPSNEEALEKLGNCIEQTRKYEEGVILYEEMLDTDAYNALAWYHLGQAYAYLGRYEEALEAMDYAYVIDESFYQACRDCADLCFELKYYNSALKYYEQLLNSASSDTDGDLHILIGRCYIELEQFQFANTFLQRAVQLDPLSDEAFFYLGKNYGAQESWNMSVHYIQKAIEIDSCSDEYFAALAEVLYRLGEHEGAIEQLNQALELNEEEARYWILMAILLMDLGEEQEAFKVLQDGENVIPGAEICYCRVACLMVIGRRQEALYWLGEALAENYEGHTALFELYPELEEDIGVISLIDSYLSF